MAVGGAVVATATAVGVTTPVVADAPYGNTGIWYNNDSVGYCGETSGGYVLAAQYWFWGAGYTITSVDDYFGPQTLNAVKFFQTLNNMIVDGCLGPVTWAIMHTYLYNANVNGDFQYLLNGQRFAAFQNATLCGYWDSYLQQNVFPAAGPVNVANNYKFSRALTPMGGKCAH